MNVVAEKDNNKTFMNFSSLSKNRFALIRNKTIGLAFLDIDKNLITIHKEVKVNQKLSLEIFVGTTEYLIVGGLSIIY